MEAYTSDPVKNYLESMGISNTSGNSLPIGTAHITNLDKNNLDVPVAPEDPPSIEDLVGYYSTSHVVGERSNCILQTLAAIGGVSVGIEGKSGSGKSLLLDSLVNILPDNSVYSAGPSSDLAFYYDSEEINSNKFIYISELQKAAKNNSISEMIKDLSEGKSSTRRAVLPGRKVAKYKIEKGKTVLYTLADENSFKKDKELSRRVLVLRTNDSQKHNEEVMQYTVERRNRGSPPPAHATRLKSHLSRCLDSSWRVIDPLSKYIRTLFPKGTSTSELKMYFKLVDASAAFHATPNTHNTIFADYSDHLLVFTIYHLRNEKGREFLRDGGLSRIADRRIATRSAQWSKEITYKQMREWEVRQSKNDPTNSWAIRYAGAPSKTL